MENSSKKNLRLKSLPNIVGSLIFLLIFLVTAFDLVELYPGCRGMIEKFYWLGVSFMGFILNLSFVIWILVVVSRVGFPRKVTIPFITGIVVLVISVGFISLVFYEEFIAK